MKHHFDKRLLNIIIIIFLSFATFAWTFWIFHKPFEAYVVLWVILTRIAASSLIFQDYSLSWSKATQKTFLIKSFVYMCAFVVYMPFFYTKLPISFFLSELFFYLFIMNFFMYLYYLLINKSKIKKDKTLVIYGAGKAGLKLEEEYRNSKYKIQYFVDDDENLQKRSIDGIKIVSKEKLKELIKKDKKPDLLVIAMPSAKPQRIISVHK
jgi:FlaA1/EpsC-like NDP-sugar epimerase